MVIKFLVKKSEFFTLNVFIVITKVKWMVFLVDILSINYDIQYVFKTHAQLSSWWLIIDLCFRSNTISLYIGWENRNNKGSLSLFKIVKVQNKLPSWCFELQIRWNWTTCRNFGDVDFWKLSNWFTTVALWNK